MDAFVVVDMQEGLRAGPPKHDLANVIDRINRLAAHVRAQAGKVIWIQHHGPAGDGFAEGAPGWALLAELDRGADDLVVAKTLNDALAGTRLPGILESLAPARVMIAGWATDFCVDSTVRGAVSAGHAVTVAGDGHTLADRPHLAAPEVIRHHNWVWSELIAPRSIRVADTAALLGAG